MNITFKPFTKEHLPLWNRWVEVPHVKNTWFMDGYEPTDKILEKIDGNGHTYPFVILVGDHPIGYIQCCDLYAYRMTVAKPDGLFADEQKNTFCVDLFIAENDYLDKGYGTQIIKLFSHKLFNEFHANKILIDPASSNKRAIRCYEKSGYSFVKEANDGVTDCTIMQLLPPNDLPFSPACERNKQPILEKLQMYIKPDDRVLEVGSGTGQHAAYFAEQMPDVIWQPTDQAEYYELLQQRMAVKTAENILPETILNVIDYDWSQQQYNVVYSANTLHIMSQAAGEAFLSQASQALYENGYLIIYGPFCYDGQFTSHSNQQFDQQLKQANADRGVREFNHINALLIDQGFMCVEDYAMPANNRLIVWRLQR